MEHKQRSRNSNLLRRDRSSRVTVSDMLLELAVYSNLKADDLRKLRVRDLSNSKEGGLKIATRDDKGRFKGCVSVHESFSSLLARLVWRNHWKDDVKGRFRAGLDRVRDRTVRLLPFRSAPETKQSSGSGFRRRRRQSLTEERPSLRFVVSL